MNPAIYCTLHAGCSPADWEAMGYTLIAVFVVFGAVALVDFFTKKK